MEPSRLVIGGTGRAGTTFLVKFLAACGIPAGDLDELAYFDHARAGLERSVEHDTGTYLVKDPLLFEYVDRIDLERTPIDAVILPVRNLRHAAMSRIRLERARRIEEGLSPDRETNAGAPGGAVYSMSVQDQERVLAVGQAKVIEWCLGHDVPLLLLHYPRLVDDGAYLVDGLWPILQAHCSRDRALQLFGEIADPRPWLVGDATELDPDEADRAVRLEAALLAVETLRDVQMRLEVRLEKARQRRDELGEAARNFERTAELRAEEIARLHQLLRDRGVDDA